MKRTGVGVAALLIFLAGLSAARAQEKLTLTLEKCLDLALSQNPFYLASQERIDAAQARVRQAAAQFFPSLAAQGQQNLDEKVFVLEFPSFIPGGKPTRAAIDFTKDYQFSLGFTLPLYTGGRLTSGYRSARLGYLTSQESSRQTTN